MRTVVRSIGWALALAGLLLLSVLLSEWMVADHASNRLFAEVATVPKVEVALVLGTAAESRGGGPNQYFKHRMSAAAALYKAGKVDHLLLSGDNGTWGYNEPMDMRNALRALGVDSADMTLDFAGFDTYDSIVRAKKIFGLDRFLVVSQRFHNERALFIAHDQDIEALAFNASEAGIQRTKWSWLRERGARLKMWVDVLLQVEPHFLGAPVELGGQVLPADMPRQ